jgi:hypothetical protein
VAAWAAVALPAVARAGPIWDWWHYRNPPECCAGSYSHWHYCAPELWNCYAYHYGVHGKPVSVYAPEPCTPVGYFIMPFPCPYAPPGIPSDAASGAHTLDFVGTPPTGTRDTLPAASDTRDRGGATPLVP